MKPGRNSFRIIIAGGGTGGHLFPGVAVAREIRKRDENASVLFVTGRRRMETEILGRYGFEQTTISIEGLKGRGWKKGASVLIKLPYSLLQSLWIVRSFSPMVVLGVGGYSSGPLCSAAKIMGVPTAVHEQNSFPGLTNRILCRLVDRVFVSFEQSKSRFPAGDIYVTGNPVREELLVKGPKPARPRDRFTVLVVGGSQGARAVNTAFTEALRILGSRGRCPAAIHQTGETDYDRVKRIYQELEIQGEILPFIRDMAEAYDRADLVVSRAGACTVSELAALGKASILIPYPHAANNHQELNAQLLVGEGGAEMVLEKDLTGELLAGLITGYMEDRDLLDRMSESAGRAGRTDAARKIVDHLMEMATA